MTLGLNDLAGHLMIGKNKKLQGESQ